MYQEKVQVLWNHEIGPGYFRMGLACHEGYAVSMPGQFVMVRLPDRLTPLLRRPFSIHRLVRQGDTVCGIELLYKVVGEGTRNFSQCTKGDYLDLIGPLGTGFTLSDNDRRIFMAAGGIGGAPMPHAMAVSMDIWHRTSCPSAISITHLSIANGPQAYTISGGPPAMARSNGCVTKH